MPAHREDAIARCALEVGARILYEDGHENVYGSGFNGNDTA